MHLQCGLFASLEEVSPATCPSQATLADEYGFDSVWVNDHFHPSYHRRADGTTAHGGNCWSWLPAALERTVTIEIGTGITPVIIRDHPADVAHRLATLADRYPDRVFSGLGRGNLRLDDELDVAGIDNGRSIAPVDERPAPGADGFAGVLHRVVQRDMQVDGLLTASTESLCVDLTTPRSSAGSSVCGCGRAPR